MIHNIYLNSCYLSFFFVVVVVFYHCINPEFVSAGSCCRLFLVVRLL